MAITAPYQRFNRAADPLLEVNTSKILFIVPEGHLLWPVPCEGAPQDFTLRMIGRALRLSAYYLIHESSLLVFVVTDTADYKPFARFLAAVHVSPVRS